MRYDSVKVAIHGRILNGFGRVFGYMMMMGSREILMMIIVEMEREMGMGIMIMEEGVVGGLKMSVATVRVKVGVISLA